MPGTWTQARLLLTRLSLALDRPAPAQPARHGGAAQAAARAAGRALQLPRHTRAGAVRGPTRTLTLPLTLTLTLPLTQAEVLGRWLLRDVKAARPILRQNGIDLIDF